ncbi:MAG: helix-turn-helix domain-containing protein [Chloroflexia bacterium]
MSRRVLMLTPEQRSELEHLRDHANKPYLRERAAALLKVADGQSASAVARNGLLRRRNPKTIWEWLNRYQAEGVAGLVVKPGRGRKPVFSPSKPGGGPR